MSTAAVPLYPYQLQWFLNRSRFKAGMFSRQSGKTFTTTLEIVDDCFGAAVEGRAERWVILSRGERQAREAMEEGIKRHAQAYSLGIESLESEFVGDQGTYKQLEVILPGGSRITALPANPDTARGFSANCFLDEFAFHADSKKIWGALFPVISKPGLKLRVVSTPNGKNNKFYEIMTGKDSAWYRQTCDICQAVRDGLPRNIEELKAALNDPDIWAQEFELNWMDEASAWLSFDLINAAEHDQAGDASQYQGGPCYVGIDIAAVRDLFVIAVFERVGDVLWLRELIVARRISFAEQDELLDGVMKRYRVMACWMDQTGMGMKPVEDAKRRYGDSRVHGVMFTAPAKQDLATKGKQSFEDRRVRIPMGDLPLRSDLHKLKRETTATGAVRFVAERDAGGHADRAWAIFLGIAAADFGGGEIDFQSAGTRATADANAVTEDGFGTVAGSNDFVGFA
ncbi:terminase [Ahniella affigens]|uniref:Terminase n=1 Tax=Ahniella affigens TaxID=2021234 RepID=A0A2P1PSU5_9GAMM|nr:terminase family protein [Ahniella affigens]AVP97913.1 terminase [Ahniella affigens]